MPSPTSTTTPKQPARPIPGKGADWGAERHAYVDPATGAHVTRWTAYRGHSHHFYFTNPAWFDGGNRVVFASDRADRPNLFSLDLRDGRILQLTDLEPVPLPRELEFVRASFNPALNEAIFFHDRELRAVNVLTLAERTLCLLPEKTVATMSNVSADGRHIYFSVNEDLSDRFEVDLLRGYVGFTEYFEARPFSQVLRVDAATGAVSTVFEERYWIGHVNTSPVHPHLLTFCHEGPWDRVDNRIWGLDAGTGKAWRIRPVTPGDLVGHEYWYADGETVGYHGRIAGREVFGQIRHDNSGCEETDAHGTTGHIHSLDGSLIVGDGGGIIRLWKKENGGYGTPRVLCRHGSSWHIQQTHPHPRISPCGRYVLFASDRRGYGDVYTVELPPWESLPEAKD